MSRFIQIVEVGPRDGLQNEAAILDVDQKVAFIRRLDAAGAKRMETVSFVNPRRVPQMAGAEEVSAAVAQTPRSSRIGLVLNERGWDRCVAAQCDEANVVVCATDGFGIRNQSAAVDDQIAALQAIAARRAHEGGPPISATISVAFGCPFEGEVPEAQVERRRIEAVRQAAPDTPLRMHFHDTRNTGLANAYAAVEAGIDVLDASCGGLGGCPFAPDATGNIGTEDLVYMLERAGFETGYDLGALIDTARWMATILGKPPAASVSRAGGFPPRT